MTMSRNPTTGGEALADKLVETVGWEEADRLIKARKPKNERGHPGYDRIDWLLIILAGALREEWRKRLGSSPRDRRLPTRHAIATKIVDMLWEDYDATKWLRSMLWTSRDATKRLRCLKDFGANKKTVVQRLMGRDAIHWEVAFTPEDEHLDELERDYPEVYVQHIEHCPRRVPGEVSAVVEMFEAMHRRRPDLHLLP
jgi:hypothetical protein